MSPPPDRPEILDSDHLSARTREILKSRLSAPETQPRTLSLQAYAVLDALLPVLLPIDEILPSGTDINVTARIDAALSGPRDGWRFADLPPDAQAWEAALLTLDDVTFEQNGLRFIHLAPDLRGTLLDALMAGQIGLEREDRLTAPQMKRWAGDLRGEVVDCVMSDPRMQQALGISSSLTGGDTVFQGFTEVGPDSREDFEPKATAPLAQMADSTQ
ncbi:gluconate 2-dehydrogenase subunit 3 family protein [Gluconobacter sp. R75690]|uniref:gluconate 2-dehydrogenase subunit 3 family protein n=1 Tax=Gluconobacter TaxID=441 RepID=UPI00188B790F|nr:MULTISPECIES: gluconate 2-dehydrogenase subunit 3 family protein [unclassified Gluconobacter]MBF0849868.1 gluconate 2-dehydrogenase subunit 3 family protein [Gluconobacter sp. R75690]MBF0878685.1 gluconate 2-dehydrogenase subunit 3 family protein [Gluconobacter sp. R75828]